MPATYFSASARAAAAAVTTITPGLPSGQSRGVVYAVVSSANNAVHATATTGWTKKGQWNSGANFTVSLFYADRSAVAAGPTVTWAGAANASGQCTGWDDPLNPLIADPGTVVSNTGTGTNHSSASFNATAPDSLAIYFDLCAVNTALATPAGWTEHADAGSATDAARTVFGSRSLTNTGDASGAIAVVGGNAAWVQLQVELRTLAATGQQTAKAEAGAWTAPTDGLMTAKAEAGAWTAPTDGLTAAKVEAGVWLRPIPAGQASIAGSASFTGAITGRRRRRRSINGALATSGFIRGAALRPGRLSGLVSIAGIVKAGAMRRGSAASVIAFAGAVAGAGGGSGVAGDLAAISIAAPGIVADLTLPILIYADLEGAAAMAGTISTFVWLGAGLGARSTIAARLTGFSPRAPDKPGETIIRAHAGEVLDHLLWRVRGGLGAGDVERTLDVNPGLAALGVRLPEGWPVVLPGLPAPSALPPERQLIQLWD